MERKLAKWEQMSNLSPRFEVRKFLEVHTAKTLHFFWILAPEFWLLSTYDGYIFLTVSINVSSVFRL